MKIGVLGLGFMGSTHLKGWMQLAGVEVVAVASDEERRLSGDLSDVQGNVGGPGERMDFSGMERYRDWKDAVASPRVEAVDICLPTHLHAAAAIAALEAGKHVLVEKPMALEADSARAMIDAARRSGRVLMVAHVLRFFPAYVVLARRVKAGDLGAVRHAVFRRRCAAPAWSGWLGDKRRSGGAILDLLIHDIDVALALFGVPLAVSATGYEDLSRGVDVITAQWHYADKTVVITGGWHHPKAYPFSMEYAVVCEGGTLEYSSAGRPPVLYTAGGEEAALPVEDKDGYVAELEYFAACCAEGRRPEACPPEESAAAVQLAAVMEEARKRNGESVPCQI